MLRRTMQIGDELHVNDHIIIVERVSKTMQIQLVVVPKTEPYVLRRSGKQSVKIGRPVVSSADVPPYHPDIETMLKV